ncbi:hypothetical protein AMTRI_Chr08g206190 [Amborella trichopoda]
MVYSTATPKQLENPKGLKSRANASYLLFVSKSPIQYAIDIVLMGKRKLQSIDDFEEYSKSYNNEYCRLGLYNNATCNAYYLASLPSNIPKLVLEIPFMKNLSVGEIKKLPYKNDTKTCLKAGSKLCNTIEEAEEHNIPKFRKSIKEEILIRISYTQETKG